MSRAREHRVCACKLHVRVRVRVRVCVCMRVRKRECGMRIHSDGGGGRGCGGGVACGMKVGGGSTPSQWDEFLAVHTIIEQKTIDVQRDCDKFTL